jgi:hypothetical protein
MPIQHKEHGAPSGCLLRLFWLIAGNAALVIVAGQLLLHPMGWLSGLDAVYWFIVALILAARYTDIRYFKGITAEGKPSRIEDWRRHAFILVLSAGAAWLTVHFLGAFGFSP